MHRGTGLALRLSPGRILRGSRVPAAVGAASPDSPGPFHAQADRPRYCSRRASCSMESRILAMSSRWCRCCGSLRGCRRCRRIGEVCTMFAEESFRRGVRNDCVVLEDLVSARLRGGSRMNSRRPLRSGPCRQSSGRRLHPQLCATTSTALARRDPEMIDHEVVDLAQRADPERSMPVASAAFFISSRLSCFAGKKWSSKMRAARCARLEPIKCIGSLDRSPMLRRYDDGCDSECSDVGSRLVCQLGEYRRDRKTFPYPTVVSPAEVGVPPMSRKLNVLSMSMRSKLTDYRLSAASLRS